jgi:hypothetical protein
VEQQARLLRVRDLRDAKLIVENDTSQVKIEVNVVFRGTALPAKRRVQSETARNMFGVELDNGSFTTWRH